MIDQKVYTPKRDRFACSFWMVHCGMLLPSLSNHRIFRVLSSLSSSHWHECKDFHWLQWTLNWAQRTHFSLIGARSAQNFWKSGHFSWYLGSRSQKGPRHLSLTFRNHLDHPNSCSAATYPHRYLHFCLWVYTKPHKSWCTEMLNTLLLPKPQQDSQTRCSSTYQASSGTCTQTILKMHKRQLKGVILEVLTWDVASLSSSSTGGIPKSPTFLMNHFNFHWARKNGRGRFYSRMVKALPGQLWFHLCFT